MTKKYLFVNTDGDYEENLSFEATEFISESAGVGSAGAPVLLNPSGTLDSSLIDLSVLDHQSLSGSGTNTHAEIDTHISDDNIHFAAGTGLEVVSNTASIDFADTATQMTGNLAVAAVDLFSTGSDQGAYIIGADPSGLAYSSNDTVQEVLEDLDDAIGDIEAPGQYYTASVGIDAGDLVYVSAADTIDIVDISTSEWGIGLAATTETSGSTVKVLANDTVVGALTGATPGDRYYWNGTALTTTKPTGGGQYLWFTGVAKNATDLHVEIERVKKNAI